MNTFRILILLAAGTALATQAGAAGIGQWKHNLSVSGLGRITASANAGNASSEVCIFCHTPHTAGKAALWNRQDSTTSYTPYSSSTVKAAIGQPTGVSKLCLSCHDGTVALGQVRSRTTPIAMKSMAAATRAEQLGHRPVKDIPSPSTTTPRWSRPTGQLANPTTLNRVHLDAKGQVNAPPATIRTVTSSESFS